MSIIGNKDIVTFTSKYNISSGGVVTRQTGSDSFFTKATVAGDSINYAGQEYVIDTVDSATQVTVNLDEFGGSITGATGATVFVQQKPKYVKFITDPSSITGRSDVYGVSTGATGTFSAPEQQVARTYNNHPQHAGWVRHKNGQGPVDSVSLTEAGSAYGTSTATVTFSSGGATGVAVMSGGAVSSVTLGNQSLYSVNAPTVSFSAPPKLTFNSKDNVGSSSETVTFTTNHNLNTGDRLVYNGASGATGMIGLTYNTTYYAKPTGATGVQFFTTLVGAQTGATAALVNLTADTGGYGVYVQGVTATGTVNMGGRFGRQLNETLVAFKNITNDASDDTVFPDS
jgi:hypothetical protein